MAKKSPFVSISSQNYAGVQGNGSSATPTAQNNLAQLGGVSGTGPYSVTNKSGAPQLRGA